MKAIRSLAVTIAGMVAILLAGLPAMAISQCPKITGAVPKAPNQQSAKVLVSTFHGTPNKLAVEFSKDIRDRIQKLVDDKVLWVIPCQEVNAYLKNSGYPVDSALAINDLAALGHQVNASESFDGTVTKNEDGSVQADGRLYYNNISSSSDPLKPVTGKDAEAAAQALVGEYMDARKELEGVKACYHAVTDQKPDLAVASAKQALAAYPSGLIPRTCLLDAYSIMPNISPDSIIAVAVGVVAGDSTNTKVLAYLGDAYLKKGDWAKTLPIYRQLYAADPSLTNVAEAIVAILAQHGEPSTAIPIIDTLLMTNPGDTTMLDTRFKLLLDAKRYKDVYKAFDVLVKVDTSKGSLIYYQRVLGAAQSDKDSAMVLLYVGQAVQKYPKESTLWELYSTELRRAGKVPEALGAAKRAVALDPKIEGGYQRVIQLYAALNEPDSAIAFAKSAIAAGASPQVIGTAIAPLLNPVEQKAHASNTREDWGTVLTTATAIDSIAPTPTTKFFMALSAATIAQSLQQEVTDILASPDKPKACPLIPTIDSMYLIAQTNMMAGGSVDQATAGNILSILGQIRTYIDDVKKTVCK